MNLKRPNVDLGKTAQHFSIIANRIREVMNCPLEVLRPLNKEDNLQATVATQPLLFTVQHCLDGSVVLVFFTTHNIHYHLYRLSCTG